MAAPRSTYKYQTLSAANHIRILHLAGMTEDEALCTLEEIPYTAGGYQALSYVWGDDQKLFRALIKDENGVPLGNIPLTKNLWCALQDLWRCEELNSKIFWIDQICIDQHSPDKGHQVSMMGNIYRHAKGVITYLGPAADSELEDEGRRLVSIIYDHFQPSYERMSELGTGILHHWHTLPVQYPPEELFEDMANLDAQIERCQMHGGQIEIPDRWKWLVEVAFGDWVTRLWMVQEQRLNNNMVMLRGANLVAWDAVAVVILLFTLEIFPPQLVLDHWTRSRNIWTGPWYCAFTIIETWRYRMLSLRDDRISSGALKDPSMNLLLTNIDLGRRLQCRDPRDRVYALLAISEDAESLEIAPNYSAENTVSDVFRAVSIKLIQNATNLQILQIICGLDNLADPEHSSWAINNPTPLEFETSTVFEPEMAAAHPRYTLSRRPRFQHNFSTLTLRGRILDVMDAAAEPTFWTQSYYFAIFDAENLRTTSQLFLSIATVTLSQDITIPNILAFCKAFVFGVSVDSSQSDPSIDDEQLVYFFWCYLRSRYLHTYNRFQLASRDLRESHEKCREIIVGIASVLTVDENWSLEVDLNQDELAGYQWMRNRAIWQGRAFGRTRSGRVFNAMNSVQEGDAVAAFEGSGMLFVLRPFGSQYRLVGDVWVEGWMRGEAYEGLDPEECDYDINII